MHTAAAKHLHRTNRQNFNFWPNHPYTELQRENAEKLKNFRIF